MDVLSDDLENYFFGQEGDNFVCLAAATSTFRHGNQQSASTLFSPDVVQADARWNGRTRNMDRGSWATPWTRSMDHP